MPELLGHAPGDSALGSTEGEDGQINDSALPRCEAGWLALLCDIKKQEGKHISFLGW